MQRLVWGGLLCPLVCLGLIQLRITAPLTAQTTSSSAGSVAASTPVAVRQWCCLPLVSSAHQRFSSWKQLPETHWTWRGLRPQPKVAITLRRDEHLSIDIHQP